MAARAFPGWRIVLRATGTMTAHPLAPQDDTAEALPAGDPDRLTRHAAADAFEDRMLAATNTWLDWCALHGVHPLTASVHDLGAAVHQLGDDGADLEAARDVIDQVG